MTQDQARTPNLSLYPPPLIIIGMHRSGTSLLAKLLQTYGVFMGADCSIHTESHFFLRENQKIFNRVQAKWDSPTHVSKIKENSSPFLQSLSEMQKAFVSTKVNSYIGKQEGNQPFFSSKSSYTWGWKDPRNTYTLPLWLNLFPETKVIHIYRNGMDVAVSLQRREFSRIIRGHSRSHQFSRRCLTFHGAFSLWEAYINQACSMMKKIPDSQSFTLSYEELLSRPAYYLGNLLHFLEYDIDVDKVNSIVSGVNAERAHAFRNSQRLRFLYRFYKNNAWMRRLGYQDI